MALKSELAVTIGYTIQHLAADTAEGKADCIAAFERLNRTLPPADDGTPLARIVRIEYLDYITL